QLVGNVLLLQAAQLLVVVGDLVEGLHHLRLQFGLDRGERHLVFEFVVVHVGLGRGLRRILLLVGTGCTAGRSTERRRCGRRGGRGDMGGRGFATGGSGLRLDQGLAIGADRG